MKRAIILISAILTVFSCFGQEKDWRLYESEPQEKTVYMDTDSVKTTPVLPGQVTLIESSRLDTLLMALQNNPPLLKGFRVRIYMGNSRNNADEIRSIYLKNEYQWQHYLTFKDPNFIVEIGDFMTRLQAEKVKNQLTNNFSNPYIVLTIIKPPEYISENK